MLTTKGLGQLDARNFGDGVRFIGRLDLTGQEIFLTHRLQRVLWVNARAAEEQKLANAVPLTGRQDVVLNVQVVQQKIDGEILVCPDSADLGCGEENFIG